MQNNGYIKKETDENDQRYTKLYLTEKGIEKSERLRMRLHRSDEFITQKIGHEKERQLEELLDLIFSVIRGEL